MTVHDAVERLPPHDGQQGVEVDVGESLGQERDLRLGVNNVPTSLHQLRLLEEPANLVINSVMPLNITTLQKLADLLSHQEEQIGISINARKMK